MTSSKKVRAILADTHSSWFITLQRKYRQLETTCFFAKLSDKIYKLKIILVSRLLQHTRPNYEWSLYLKCYNSRTWLCQEWKAFWRWSWGQAASGSSWNLPGQEPDADRLQGQAVRWLLSNQSCQLLPKTDTQINSNWYSQQ